MDEGGGFPLYKDIYSLGKYLQLFEKYQLGIHNYIV